MEKYLIYLASATDPIFIECTDFNVNFDYRKITFKDGNNNIAVFNFDNIIGFTKATNDPYYKLKNESALLKDNIVNIGELNEITVTITLEEYRNLIENRCYSDKKIEELQEEVESLRTKCDVYLKMILKNYPELYEKMIDCASFLAGEISAALFACDDTEESEGEDNERT